MKTPNHTVTLLTLFAATVAPGLARAQAPDLAVLLPLGLVDTARYPDQAARARDLPARLRGRLVDALRADGQVVHVPDGLDALGPRYLARRFGPQSLAEIQRRTKAPRFVMGFVDFDGEALEVKLRLHDGETGRPVRLVVRRGDPEDLEALAKDLAEGLTAEASTPPAARAPVAEAAAPAPPSDDEARAASDPHDEAGATSPAEEPATTPPEASPASTVADAAAVAATPAAGVTAEAGVGGGGGPNVPARVLFWGGLSLLAASAAVGAVSIFHYERTLEDGTLRSGADNQALYDTGRSLGVGAEIGAGVGLGAMALGAIFWATGVGESDLEPRLSLGVSAERVDARLGLRF